MTTPESARIEPGSWRTSSNEAERAQLLDALWQVMPPSLTVVLPPHTIEFTPAQDGHGLEARAHQWGPVRVSLYLSRGGTLWIEDGTNTLTGQPLTIKTLLDIAEAVQDALSADPKHGKRIQGTQAVGYQVRWRQLRRHPGRGRRRRPPRDRGVGGAAATSRFRRSPSQRDRRRRQLGAGCEA